MNKRNTETTKQKKPMHSLTETGAEVGIELTEQDLKKVSGGLKLDKKI
jgi:bacteriocin-like protein